MPCRHHACDKVSQQRCPGQAAANPYNDAMNPGTVPLRLLLQLRTITLLLQAAVLALAHFALGMTLPVRIDAALLLFTAAAAGPALAYVRRGGSESRAVAAIIGLDLAALTALLYLNGGYANPLACLYLPCLAVAAATLPRALALGFAALAVAGYTAVALYYRPLPHYHGVLGDSFDLHLLGMWLCFVLAAAVIAWFVSRLAEALRLREQRLAQAREAALETEHLAALGALAAGTAHELGTPLNSALLLGQELRSAGAADADLLCGELDRCKTLLDRMLGMAGAPRGGGGGSVCLATWLQRLLDDWQARRGVRVTTELPQASQRIVADQALGQSLVSLLDNAADASPAAVSLRVAVSAQSLSFEVGDRGPGVQRDLLPRVGTPYFSTKPQGHGLGLYLARAVAQRLGGDLVLRARPGGGTCACLSLPAGRLLTTETGHAAGQAAAAG